MILKQYLQERFGFDLLSKTDQEMVVHLQSIAFSREIIDMLRTIIDDGLMVKFAQYQVIREKMNKDLQLGITIVQRTTPRPI
jgi:hypothetical protein